MIVKGKELGSPNTIVGDPTAMGGTLTITMDGGTPVSETFNLPQGVKADGEPFWTGDAVKGYKYKDKLQESGTPVKSALIKQSSTGAFSIKAVVGTGTLLLPPNPGTDACARLELTGGDSYDIKFSEANGQITNRDAQKYSHKKVTVEGHCCEAITGGFCWYLSDSGAPCNSITAYAGFSVDPAADAFAGGAGTDANCGAVLDDLGIPAGAVIQSNLCDAGCIWDGVSRIRCTLPGSENSSVPGAVLACGTY